MMNIQPIRSDTDLDRAFARMEELWSAEAGTLEADEMEVLSILIEKYENEHYPIGPSDPVEAIKFRMEQQGLTQQDLVPYFGTSGRTSEVLHRRRGLSLSMIKKLHTGLKIPYENLLGETTDV
ncbi:helix-turn-helix domain-containing protein [Halomonas sp. AOP43-A1-21]